MGDSQRARNNIPNRFGYQRTWLSCYRRLKTSRSCTILLIWGFVYLRKHKWSSSSGARSQQPAEFVCSKTTPDIAAAPQFIGIPISPQINWIIDLDGAPSSRNLITFLKLWVVSHLESRIRNKDYCFGVYTSEIG